MNKRGELVGQCFGRLKVVKRVENNKYIERCWLCICECGNETILSTRKLRTNHTKSCGCYKHDIRFLPEGVASRNAIYSNYKRDSGKQNREFSLSIEEFIEITKRNCHYCGIEPSEFSLRGNANGSYVGNGIDRKDNSLGYTIENCLPCCRKCNFCKGKLPYDEFMSWIKRVIKHNDKESSYGSYNIQK